MRTAGDASGVGEAVGHARRGHLACLLTDEEMALGPAKWAELTDPFG
jgi:hypothetical protein